LTLLAAVLSSGSNSSTLNDVEPGLLAFLVIAGIGIALVFLMRSMNKQFRKLPPPPEETETGEDTSNPASTDAEGAKRG
jgi:hypothetical protein